MAFAPAHRPAAARRASRDLTDVLLVASVVFVSVIAAVAAVVVVIKQVHIVVQITEERAQLRTIALRSAESACVSRVINPTVVIGLIVIAALFLRVAALTQKETKLNRSRLIVWDDVSAKDVATAMRAVRIQDAKDVGFHLVCFSPRQKSSKDRDGEGAAVVKHTLLGGDLAWNHESGSVKRKNVQAP